MNKLNIFLVSTILLLTALTKAYADEGQEPVVAGSFYTANSSKLDTLVSGLIKNANPNPIQGEILGLILPHAGYVYSGKTAAYGIKTVANNEIDTVIIVGLSHRTPFDLPEAEHELTAGFHTEYSGMKFGMFFIGEYVSVILTSAMMVVLFLGGWLGPSWSFLAWVPPVFWFLL